MVDRGGDLLHQSKWTAVQLRLRAREPRALARSDACDLSEVLAHARDGSRVACLAAPEAISEPRNQEMSVSRLALWISTPLRPILSYTYFFLFDIHICIILR